MRKSILLIVLASFVTLNLSAQKKIIIFSKTSGYRHKSIEVGTEGIKKLCKENGFSADATENSEELIKNLKKYKAVVFLNTTGDVFNEKQQKKFKKYIEKGGGFVGVHSATDTEYDWPWYGKMVGAYFLKHPKQQTAKIDIIDCDHKATSFLGKTWSKFDEWYNFKNINPDIHVLMKLDESSYKGGVNGDNHPISWVQNIKKGKMFYTGLGHTEKSYSDEKFLKHLLGGIQYVLKK